MDVELVVWKECLMASFAVVLMALCWAGEMAVKMVASSVEY